MKINSEHKYTWKNNLGSLTISSFLCFIPFPHPPMLEQTLKSMLQVCFQIVQPRLGPRLTGLDTAHYHQLNLPHAPLHIISLPEIQSHFFCTLMEVLLNIISACINDMAVSGIQ